MRVLSLTFMFGLLGIIKACGYKFKDNEKFNCGYCKRKPNKKAQDFFDFDTNGSFLEYNNTEYNEGYG